MALDLQINYEQVSSVCTKCKSNLSEDCEDAKNDLKKAENSLKKACGKTLDEIKNQLSKDTILMNITNKTCDKLIVAIENAAKTFKVLDQNMAGKLNSNILMH